MKQKIIYVGIALLSGFVGYISSDISSFSAFWSSDMTLFMIITISGAFGGLLYTSRDSGFELPHKDPTAPHVWKLGWVSDCAYGIAGGYVVFLIVPTDLSAANSAAATGGVLDFVKLVALALVGGYGGRSLVDRALANIARDVEQVKKTAQETKDQLSLTQETDTHAKASVNEHLDENSDIQDIDQMKEGIKAASLAARFEIFKEARSVRHKNWGKNKPLMERTIPVFEALIDNTAGEKFHRTHGQLGYALKDKESPDWKRAHEQITKAIELRDDNQVKGFLMYEFNRALCGIHSAHSVDSISRDIQAAGQRDSLKVKMQQDKGFSEWARSVDMTI